MGTILAFPHKPRAPRPTGPTGIRVAMVGGDWCVELLEGGVVTRRTRMPSLDDARRVADRISLRDRATRLGMAVSDAPRAIDEGIGPDDHQPGPAAA